MKKNQVKYLPLAMSLCLTVSFLSGCAYEDKKKNQELTSSYVGEVSDDFWKPVDFIPVFETTKESSYIEELPNNTEPTKINVEELSPLEEYEKSLMESLVPSNIGDVLTNPENYDEKTCEICAYANLKNHGYNLNDVLDELNNIMVYSQVPTELPLDVWIKVVGKLDATLDIPCNPFSTYRALAKCVHLISCDLTHTEEYGIFTCSYLKAESEKVRPKPIEEYFDDVLKDDYAYSKIKKALNENEFLTINDFIIELENLVACQETPTDFYDQDDWNSLFGDLTNTLLEDETLYEVYIDLAVFVHNTIDPENEFVKNSDGLYRKRILN